MAQRGKVSVTTVTVTDGRAGHAVSDAGVLDVPLRRPKVNGVSDGTTPEQRFAAAWGGYGLSATSAVDIPAMEQQQAQELANVAHEHCPYTSATRGNLDVEVPAHSRCYKETVVRSHAWYTARCSAAPHPTRTSGYA